MRLREAATASQFSSPPLPPPFPLLLLYPGERDTNMEPEDLPWPGELEEEEEEEAGEEEEEVQEEEVQEEKEEVEKPENLDEDEVVTVEDEEVEERRELDFNYESQPLESTDDEEDEEAKAWLLAHPGGTLPPTSLPKHRYSESEPTGREKVGQTGRRCGPPAGQGDGSTLSAPLAL